MECLCFQINNLEYKICVSKILCAFVFSKFLCLSLTMQFEITVLFLIWYHHGVVPHGEIPLFPEFQGILGDQMGAANFEAIYRNV